jgi:hypothetical protein
MLLLPEVSSATYFMLYFKQINIIPNLYLILLKHIGKESYPSFRSESTFLAFFMQESSTSCLAVKTVISPLTWNSVPSLIAGPYFPSLNFFSLVGTVLRLCTGDQHYVPYTLLLIS